MLRRLLAPALVVVALAGATSCGGAEERTSEPPPRPAGAEPPLLSSRELAWIRGFSALAGLLYDGDLTAGRPGQRTCFERLEKAGGSPTARLRPAYATVREACGKLGTGGIQQAEQLFDETYDLLGPLFLSSRVLRVARSPDDASHVDLTLGELASAVSGESVEVRCWSQRDWRRLIVEENAWDASEEDPELLDGLALTDDGQMHLLLEDCNLLARLKHKDATELRGEEIVNAAYAVSILAHEIGHFVEPEADEATVECTVTETLPELADGLWLDAPEVRRLVRAYRAHARTELPEDYLKDCG